MHLLVGHRGFCGRCVVFGSDLHNARRQNREIMMCGSKKSVYLKNTPNMATNSITHAEWIIIFVCFWLIRRQQEEMVYLPSTCINACQWWIKSSQCLVWINSLLVIIKSHSFHIKTQPTCCLLWAFCTGMMLVIWEQLRIKSHCKEKTQLLLIQESWGFWIKSSNCCIV